MADRPSMGTQVVDRFGKLVTGMVGEHPRRAAALLHTGFAAKRFQTRHLPEARQLRSGQMGARIALESVTGALDRPNDAVLTSMFMPNELFLALGLRPLIAEALAEFTTGAWAEEGFVRAAEQAGVPETYCSFHKVLIGSAMAGSLEPPRFIANCSVACDANNITFKWLANKLGSPHFYVDVPYEYSEDACAYVADQLRELAGQLEQAYGRTLDEERLRTHVARSQETLDALVRGLPLRRGRFLHNDMGLEMQQALAAHIALGTQDTLDMARQQLDDLARTEGYQGLSLAWMHTAPFFSASLQKLVDYNQRAQIVVSDMCFDQVSLEGWSLEDGEWRRDGSAPAWAHAADEPWEAMAERLIKNVFNGPGERRVERVRRIAQVAGADGVVCFCHWGCKETMGISQLAKRELEDAGIPTLVLDGDCVQRSNNAEGQASTRMGAFLETLETRREEAR